MATQIKDLFELRIGRSINHAPAVDVDRITAEFSPDKVWRYRLTLPFRDRSRPLVSVLLKNPSSATEHAADKTVRTVTEYIWRRYPEAGGVHILNLFALRGTDSAEVGRVLIERGLPYVVGAENDRMIAETLATTPTVLLAWGGPAGIPSGPYSRRIEACLQLVPADAVLWRNSRKGSDQFPFHACYWGYADPMVPIDRKEITRAGPG